MPSLQYSYVPWDYSDGAIGISKKFTDLHAEYTDEIMKAFDEAVKSGEPVNAPIWWLDPTDKIAMGIDDGNRLRISLQIIVLISRIVFFSHLFH